MSKGLKHDQQKLRTDLIPSIAIHELSKVLTFGASKYEANNWQKGIEHSRLFAACLRHLYAYKSGESLDRESGINHISHAICNLVFLLWMIENRKDLDDLQETGTKTKPNLPEMHGLDAGEQDESGLAKMLLWLHG